MKKKKNDNFYLVSGGDFDDDCPICRAIKAGKTSITDLVKAFEEAKENGAIVGGDFFEEKES